MNFYIFKKGFALIGTMIFLMLVLIMWMSVPRLTATNLRMAKYLTTDKEYNESALRAVSWGLTLLETGHPSGSSYSCRMKLNPTTTYVVTYTRTQKIGGSRHYIVTARPAAGTDSSLPPAPSHF